jgi:pimeloyl-ACP methyl ester carboxylesterase
VLYSLQRVTHGPCSLRVRLVGEGPALCLLPGLGRPAEDLDPLAERLVSAGFRVLQPDPRGSGGSTGPLENLTLHDLAADVAAVIDDLAETDIVLIGHAFGNRIARTLAADRPDLVRRVILLGCSGMVQPTPEIAEAIRLAQAVDTPESDRAPAVQAAWFGPGRDISVWMHNWSQAVMQSYLAAADATPIEDWWTAGTAEIVIIQGLLDVAAPPENGRLLKAQIGSRARLIELAGIGHALPVEAPDEVAAVIIRELNSAGSVH